VQVNTTPLLQHQAQFDLKPALLEVRETAIFGAFSFETKMAHLAGTTMAYREPKFFMFIHKLNKRARLINASTYRPQSAFKTRETDNTRKLLADRLLRQLYPKP